MYTPFAFLIIMYLIFVDLAFFHIKNSVSWKRTRYTLWVVSVYPVSKRVLYCCFLKENQTIGSRKFVDLQHEIHISISILLQ